MRSTVRGPLGWALAAGLVFAAACGGAGTGGPSPAAGPKLGSQDRPIHLAITPSQEVQRLTATGNVIAAALGRSTGLNWKVSVPTSYAAQIDAVCAGQVDVAFIAPLQMTLALDKNCATPIAAALRKDAEGKLTTTYESQVLVRKDSGIKTIADLKGKKFAFTDAISASGYLFPSLLIKNRTSQDPKTFFGANNVIFAGGHPQAVLAVYNKQVDGASMFIDARVKDLQTRQLADGMPANILETTEVIDKAGPIPNDAIALRKDLPKDVADQIKKALLDYGTTDDGKKNYKDLFAWDGLQEVGPTFYDPIREAARLAGIDVAAEAAKTPRPPATAAPSPSPSKSP
ncbi:MAG TPA: phosphate/phosphite/phosphonate ABC transporter substrate-binding protein [Candidatus Limnocylindria bacterium]|jgi:phosphonate transport system substrate-binding protein|nr:phosphate/phosphite/phosphonate ABC transporter substrate-binding protein [Candidatus Limnocylindria bacterium]